MEERERTRPQTEEAESEADVEAHRNVPRGDEGDEAVKGRRASEDPDVEGHTHKPNVRP
jgi:hypothetical protein